MNYLNNNFNLCFLGLYSELFLLLSLLFAICFLVILDNKFNHKINLINIANSLFIYILICNLLLIKNLFSIELSLFYDILISNRYVVLCKYFLTILFIIISVLSKSYFKKEQIYIYEYFLILGLVLFGLFTIVSSNDLLVMYIGIEILSLSFYILATLKLNSNFSTEAGLKYFILGSFSSGLLLYGTSLIYGATGTLNFSDIHLLWDEMVFLTLIDPNTLIIGSIFVSVAILFKLGAAPFHMWLPDVYEGAPTIITMIFSIVPKLAIFILFYHLGVNFFNFTLIYLWHLLFFVSVISIAVGTFGALYQTKIKRMLAYSAISHVGFLLIAFLIFKTSTLFSLFFYITVYIIISLNIFTLLFVTRKYTNNLKLKKINEFSILFKSNPILAINFALILFSIAGIPPLVGFYSKFYIFTFALKYELYMIVISAAILSVIGCMYYIRLIKLMFFKNFNYWTLFQTINKFESYLLSITLMFNVLFFCYPELFVVGLYNIILEANF